MKRLNGAFNVCKSPREPREKDVQKHKTKAFVESIARRCFGHNYKGLASTKSSSRRCTFKYKLIVTKPSAIEYVHYFNKELQARFTDFKVDYNGSINSRTGREEWHIEILVFGGFVSKVYDEHKHAETSPSPRNGLTS